MVNKFIGLDLGKEKAAACVLDPEGSVLKRLNFSVDLENILQFSDSVGTDSRIALEVSTNTYAVSQILLRKGHSVVVSNPMLTKAIATSKIKTDKVDAKILAELLRCNFLPTVWIPDDATNQLRLLVSHQALLQKLKVRLKNKLRSILHRNLIDYPFSSLDVKAGRMWFSNLDLPFHETIQISTTLPVLEAIEKEEEKLEQELAKRAMANEDAKRLMTIPGIDFASALTALSAIGDVKRFKNPKHLASYFGLVPSLYESGQTSYKGSITKTGNSLARWTLIQCANSTLRVDHPLRAFYGRIKKKKGHCVAVTAVARKLLTIIWHMLTKKESYLFERPVLTERKLERLRKLATGERPESLEPKAVDVPKKVAMKKSIKKKKEEHLKKEAVSGSTCSKAQT